MKEIIQKLKEFADSDCDNKCSKCPLSTTILLTELGDYDICDFLNLVKNVKE